MKRCRGNLRPAPAYFTPELVGRIIEQIGKPQVVKSGGTSPPFITVVTLAPAKPKLRAVKSIDETTSPLPALESQPAVEIEASAGREAVARSAVDLPARNSTRPQQAPNWTPEEDDRLRAAYANDERIDLLAEELGRTARATYSRALKLQLCHGRPIKGGFIKHATWSPEEDALLRRHYGEVRTKELPRLIGRSKAAIFNRAHQLGLHADYHRQFTNAELRALQIAFDRGLAIADVAAALGRKPFSLSKYANNHGYRFGQRPLLVEPITLEGILQLADLDRPLPALRERKGTIAKREAARRKAARTQECEARRAERNRERSAAAERRAAAKIEAARKREEKRAKERADCEALELELLRIAHARGLAILEVIRAAPRSKRTIKRLAAKHGLAFGNRPLLVEPLSAEQLLALADEAVPLPELHSIRPRRARRPRPESARGSPAARRRPAPVSSPALAAIDDLDRERADRASQRRANAVRRGIMAKAEMLVDSGKPITKATNAHVKMAARVVEARRAEDARQSCPIEQAKIILQRRRVVYSMSVHGGDPSLFFISGLGSNVTSEQLLAAADRERERMAR